MAIEWIALRADYESGRVRIGELAKKYRCKTQTIDRRAAKEGWNKPASNEPEEGSERQTKIRPAALKPGVKSSKRILGEHRMLWASVKGTLVEGIAKSDEKRLKVAKIAGDGLLNIVKGERQAWGITEDDVGSTPEDILNAIKEIEEATASCGAETALEGE